MNSLSAEANYVLQFINQTQRSVFLTGKAGTGKTTLLREIIQTTHKKTVVVAPTGIAALNASGVTIHSLFQLPFGAFLPTDATPALSSLVNYETKATLARHFRMNASKKAVLQSLELLVIDEVSMLRADLLDAIDFTLQSIRKNPNPFGGVQVLFIGDLFQLPPVVKDQEWQLLRQFYRGKFFFHSLVTQRQPPLYIELPKIFRQSDTVFIKILNQLRNNELRREDLQMLQQYVQPEFKANPESGYITLTTHNAQADAMNQKSLEELQGSVVTYLPEIVGDFPEKMYPIEAALELKIGAQVMFIKNDWSAQKQYYNGKMGVVTSLSEDEILVRFPDENTTITVEKYEWQNIRYTLDDQTREIKEEILGTFVHYPLRLAWAITVHKSQGLTFERAALDVSQVFMPGQAYVALSRLRSLDGLILLSPIQMNGLSNDEEVVQYSSGQLSQEEIKDELNFETQKYIQHFLIQAFDWTNLIQHWRHHRYSYHQKTQNSEKAKHAVWAQNQLDKIEQLALPAQKFQQQLRRLFSISPIDFEHITERILAAYDYFFPVLDALLTDLFLTMEIASHARKAQGFYEELLELEIHQSQAISELMRAKNLVQIITQNLPISKENMQSDELKNYRLRKLESARASYLEQHASLIDSEASFEIEKPSKSRKVKAPKKSTYLETLELWHQQNTLKEIARIRKLTPQTIATHMAKLIEIKAVSIEDVLPEDKREALAEAFKGYNETSLNPLKEKYGDEFTWDELKMFRASL
ncbi:MAG: helix-turn-helix domain-containing protein [Bacteroidetes bacterium]|nr:helix-turn-helix domain-containing protein [Bacteroidota bacterium]